MYIHGRTISTVIFSTPKIRPLKGEHLKIAIKIASKEPNPMNTENLNQTIKKKIIKKKRKKKKGENKK